MFLMHNSINLNFENLSTATITQTYQQLFNLQKVKIGLNQLNFHAGLNLASTY